jgi:hypothetical protein
MGANQRLKISAFSMERSSSWAEFQMFSAEDCIFKFPNPFQDLFTCVYDTQSNYVSAKLLQACQKRAIISEALLIQRERTPHARMQIQSLTKQHLTNQLTCLLPGKKETAAEPMIQKCSCDGSF